ncbi:MAG TPA: ribosomal protein S18-alanine N-acetyltransferase [Ktedonobacterales bacterium]|nr:ribosomal protein S18-alanine N-acetyltransferase [Ktedonobacterales bacterium]
MADIPRITEIEKLAYEAPWPTSAYRKELQENRWAHYIVARDLWLSAAAEPPVEQSEPPRRAFPLSLLPSRSASPLARPELASIVGFAGLWLMMDEAHITTIATHPDFRRRHVGELMLASLIDIAYTIRAQRVTLEVRVSNAVAQNLYRKYGFQDVGLRRRYYSDNHEDARLMSTTEIHSTDYRSHLLRLKAALAASLDAENSNPGRAAPARGAADAG